MFRTPASSVMLLCVVSAIPVCAARPTYPCYRPAVAAVIDGDVAADPAWANIPAVTGFTVLGDGFTVAKQTVAQACWDDQALCVAVTCEEPDVARLTQKMHDGGPFWEEDGVELFFQPGESKPVLQFGITAFGAKGGWEGSPDFTKFQAAGKLGADSYCLEVRLPYGVLNATPQVGDKWLGAFCRNIWTTNSGGDKFTCWPPLKTRFCEPESFATLSFRGPAPEPKRAAQISEQLSRPYRTHLVVRLRAALPLSKGYLPALAEAAADEQFGKQAAELQQRWEEMQRLGKEANTAPILDLRHTTASVDALVKASYDLKYAYLIAKLLREN